MFTISKQVTTTYDSSTNEEELVEISEDITMVIFKTGTGKKKKTEYEFITKAKFTGAHNFKIGKKVHVCLGSTVGVPHRHYVDYTFNKKPSYDFTESNVKLILKKLLKDPNLGILGDL